MSIPSQSRQAWLTAVLPVGMILVACLGAWNFPGTFQDLSWAIVPGLMLVMFGMGITLDGDQLGGVARKPGIVLIGLALQYSVMPVTAWLLSWLLALPAALAVGLILTGSCPGGTASNVMAFLARGNVALSVAMTTASTLAAPLMTPWLVYWLAGERIETPVLPMFASILSIVVLPVAAGFLVNRFLSGLSRRMRPALPYICFAVVALIVAIIVAMNRDHLRSTGVVLAAAVASHNGLGLVLGKIAARLLGASEAEARTIAFEVGMQNSGLASALSVQFFPILTALPAALFSVWHNLSALALVGWWRFKPSPESEGADAAER